MAAPLGIILTGELSVPKSDHYTFFLNSDDGSQMFLDDQVLITNLGVHAPKIVFNQIDLKKGWHKIMIRYNDYGGGMLLELSWARGKTPGEVIKPEFFRITDETLKEAQ